MERDDAVLTRTFGRVGDCAPCALWEAGLSSVRARVLPWEHESRFKRETCAVTCTWHSSFTRLPNMQQPKPPTAPPSLEERVGRLSECGQTKGHS